MSQWIENTLESLGYWGVSLLMFLENVFPPIPSEVVMPLAGYFTVQGDLSLAGVIAAGTAGSVAGALPLYYLGKWVGEERLERWAERHGHWLVLSRKDLRKVDDWFDRHGKKAVFFGRLVPGIRSLISIPAGVYDMRLLPFLIWTAAGAAIWTALLGWLGSWLGSEYEQVGRYLGPVGTVVIAGLVLWYVVAVWRRRRARAERGGT
jgi:membrane protein DedA with SNARE-associated domain